MTTLTNIYRVCVILSLSLLATGCFVPEKSSLASHEAATKIPAIKVAGDKKDPNARFALVEALDDPDPAIRFAAINALRQYATEDQSGYRYYDETDARRPAVQWWHKWLGDRPATVPATSRSTTGPVSP